MIRFRYSLVWLLSFSTLLQTCVWGAESGIELCVAVDDCNLTWTTGGTADWDGQSVVTHDSVDAAVSGPIGNSHDSWIETTTEVGGSLSFWWKVSSERNFDFLEFWVDGVRIDRISGEVDWRNETIELPAGPHVLRWRFDKDYSISRGADSGYLDEVVFSPDQLLLTPDEGAEFTGIVGQGFGSSAVDYTLSNPTSSSLNWSTAATENWLTLNPASGVLPAGESVTVSVSVNSAANSLAVGTYSASVSVSRVSPDLTLSRSVNLTVLPVPGEVAVEDSIPPADDLAMGFDPIRIGEMVTQQVTVRNVDGINPLIVSEVDLRSSSSGSVFSVLNKEPVEEPDRRADVDLLSAENYHPQQLLVGFEDGGDLAQRQVVHETVGTKQIHSYGRISVDLVEFDEGTDIKAVIAAYRQQPGIAYVEPNYELQADRVPNDLEFATLWGLENTGQNGGVAGADISATEAWDIGTGSRDIIVAIIDTGIDYNHPDLVANMWVNPDPTFGDVHGARWTGGNGSVTSGDPMDGNGHGTHCAGTIGAVGDNGLGVAGVNWRVRLMALKFLSDSGGGYTADAVSAVEYAIDHGAHLTSNSWGGGGFSQALYDMIQAARAADQLFVAAAGNSSRDTDSSAHYPSSYDLDNVISVASMDRHNQRSSFSNYGLVSVDLAAPGSAINSTWPGGGYNSISGTSMATPHVAGAAALLLSVNPAAAYGQIRDWLFEGVVAEPVWDGLVATGGRLNVAQSLELGSPAFSLSGLPSFPATIQPGQSLTFDVVFAPTTAGSHTRELSVRTNDADESTVTLELTGSAFTNPLGVSPESGFSATGNSGGPFEPSSYTYRLTNQADAPISWSAETDVNWFQTTPASGNLASGEFVDVLVDFTVSAELLPGGTHQAELRFVDDTNGITQTRSVALDLVLSLCDAVEACELTWTTGGDGVWFSQVVESYDGDDALESDDINHRDDAWVETSVSGPGTLSFWWKVASEQNYDYLRFYVDGVQQERISGNRDWEQRVYDLEEGEHVLRWRYTKDGSVSRYSDSGFLDQVIYLPDAIEVTPEDTFESTLAIGGNPNPASRAYELQNISNQSLSWTLTFTESWLEGDSLSGTLQPNETADVTISVGSEASLLGVGEYDAEIRFSSDSPEVTLVRSMQLRVVPTPGEIVVEDSIAPNDDLQMSFGNVPVGSPVQEQVTIRNVDGNHPLEISQVRVQSGGGGPNAATRPISRVAVQNVRRTNVIDGNPFAAAHHPRYLIVRFKEGGGLGQRDAIHESVGTRMVHRYGLVPIEVVEAPEGADLEAIRLDYLANEQVGFVEPNYEVESIALPNDPDFGQLWGLKNTGQSGGTAGADIKVEGAWDIAVGSPNVVVGVIDTGIEYTHPDLAANMWVNPNPTNGDVHGARWTSGSGSMTSGDPTDGHGHGTHVAGTIGAVGDNAVGVAGVSWQVQLMALKFLSDSGGGYIADAISAVEYAVSHGAHLTSNSWGGGGFSQAMRDMLTAARDANQLFIAAAGNDSSNNDSSPFYPASYDVENVISVASSNRTDGRSSFSNYGATTVDLAAPGSAIYSTWIGGGYNSISGTSMAAPHVSGVAALLLSRDLGAAFSDVKDWILSSAEPQPAWSGRTVTEARLDAEQALLLGRSVFELSGLPSLPLTIAPGESITLEVSFDPSFDGMIQGVLEIESNDADESIVTVALDGNGFADPLGLSPATDFDAGGDAGGPIMPPSMSYSVENFSGATLSWSLEFDDNWYDVTPTSGSLAPGGSTQITVALNALAELLGPGQHSSEFRLLGSSGQVVESRSVNVDLTATLCGALDACELVWTTGGDAEWVAQVDVTHDNSDAVTNENIGHRDESWVETTVVGPGVLNFWWKVSSEANYDHLEFFIDGVVQEAISGNMDWTELAFQIEDGSHVLRWRYDKDASVSRGADAGYLDEVSYVPDSLLVTPESPFELQGIVGGPFDPNSRVYQLENIADGPIVWTAAMTEAWLDADPATGTLSPGATVEVTVRTTVPANSLPAGSHFAQVVFSSPVPEVSLSRDVSLTIHPVPGEIAIEDSISPEDDQQLPFGTILVGNGATGEVIIHNQHGEQPLEVEEIQLRVDSGSADSVGAANVEGNGSSGVVVRPMVTSSIRQADPFSTEEYVPNQLIIGYKDAGELQLNAKDSLQVGATSVKTFQVAPLELVELPKGSDLAAVRRQYLENDAVGFVEPNYLLRADRLPDDTRFGDLWGLKNTGQSGGETGADINIESAWNRTVGSTDVIVAVIDTGVDYNHPDLAANMWVNPNPTFGDVHGARWTGGSGSVTSGDPMDGNGHGTHVAGTIGAIGNNALGVVGVNWNVRIMALKFLRDSGSGTLADALSAIEYAIQHGAHISNNSWGGGGFSQAMHNMISAAADANQLFVAAAGNSAANTDSNPHFPSSYDLDNIISVASTDRFDQRSSFSNFGLTSVDIAAPGSAILSTWPGGGYNSISGTSMASPHVAGVAALLLANNPGASFAGLKQWIMDGAEPRPVWDGLTVTGARLDATGALDLSSPDFQLSGLPELPLTIPAGESVSFSVDFTPSGDADFSGRVVIQSNDLDEPSSEVLLVGTGISSFLVVTPETDVESSGNVGGPFAPVQAEYALTNEGTTALDWQVESTAAWLEVTPNAGSLAVGESVSVSIALTTAANLLGAGLHSDRIRFVDLTHSSEETRRFSLEISLPLCVALDNCDLSYSDGGVAPFFGQSDISHDDKHSGQSGDVENNQASILTTELVGPGTLSFWWRVSSERSYDFLSFYFDGERVDRISGETDWTQVELTVGSGSHVLEWRYTKDRSLSRGGDAGWVDEVTFVADAMQVDPSGPGSMQGFAGGPFLPQETVFTITNLRDVPFDWSLGTIPAWLTAQPASGTLGPEEAVDVVLTSNEVTEGLDPGDYQQTVVFSNDTVGQTREREFMLRVHPPICDAVDNCFLTWTGGGGAGWFAQSIETYDGQDAAESGAIGHGEESWLETFIPGAGTVSFWWNVSSENNFDFLQLEIDGELVEAISGIRDWERVTIDLGDGAHSIRWRYVKDRSVSRGADAGWVDQVVFFPGDFAVVPEEGFASEGTEGGPFGPGSRVYSIENRSSDVLEWSAASSLPWLEIAPASGSLPAGEQTNIEVRLNSAANSLEVGDYEGRFEVVNTALSLGLQRPVTLAVHPAAGEIGVSDSIPPSDDHAMIFSEVLVGAHRAEQLILENTDADNVLTVNDIRLETVVPGGTAEDANGTDGGRVPMKPDLQLEEGGFLPRQLLVGFRGNDGVREALNLHTAMGATRIYRFSMLSVDVVSVPEELDFAKVMENYNNHPDVAYAEPNYEISAFLVPNDPDFPVQWNLHNSGQNGGVADADVDAPEAWDVVTGSEEVVVAVLDTGIDYQHSNLAANMWTNPNPTFGDVHGARWTSGSGLQTSGDPMDDHGHGTHVAGTIGAVGNDGLGVTGVAWNVRLMALKFLNASGRGYTADAIAAIEYAVNHGAKISNCSWGSTRYSQALADAIQVGEMNNHLFVAAAGNSNRDNDIRAHYPSSYSALNVIAVASSDRFDNRSSFSNWGLTSVDLAAPGSSILSTWPNDAFRELNGTSMATPHVAGAAALLCALQPGASYAEIRSWLLSSVKPRAAWDGLVASGGLLSIGNSVRSAVSQFQLNNVPGLPFDLAPGASVAIEVVYGPNYEGAHQALVSLESNDPSTPLLDVALSGEGFVNALGVDPESDFVSAGSADGGFEPPSMVYTLINEGESVLSWSIDFAVDWIEVVPSQGSLLPGATTDVGVSIGAAANSLPPGVHEAELAFSDGERQATNIRRVELLINEGICLAVDNCNLIWEMGGDAEWESQDSDTVDGVDAAMSQDIGNNQQTWIQTTVDSPGMLSFWWRASSEAGWDFFRFFIDGDEVEQISGETEWEQRFFFLGAGSHELSWVYTKDVIISHGADAGFLDQVLFTPEFFSVTPFVPLELSMDHGGTLPNVEYGLSNLGTDLLTWAVSTDVDWIGLGAGGGELGVGEEAQLQVEFNALASALPVGSHTATITFEDTLNNSTQDREVVLNILAPICEAFEACNQTWQRGGDAIWFSQSDVTNDGVDAGQSGDVGNNQRSWIETSVSGPASVSFWWKVSSERSYDYLRFMVDGASVQQISGDVDWEQVSYALPEGEHVLRWIYDKDFSVSSRLDAGFLDQVSIVPRALVVAPDERVSLTGYAGGPFSSGEFELSNVGGEAMSWTGTESSDWLVLSPASGSLAPGASATVGVETVAAANSLSAGAYTAAIEFGSTASSATEPRQVMLEVYESICEAIEACGLSWVTGGNRPWIPVTSDSNDGVDSAANDDIGNRQDSWLETTVLGPGTLSFWWKVSSETNYDFLEFYVDGILQNDISGFVDWNQQAYAISEGAHVLRWRYAKDGSVSSRADTGYIDEVSFVPDAFSVTPFAGFDSVGLAGGGFDPGSRTYTIENLSGNAISWNSSTDVSWLEVIPSSGSVPAGGSLDVEIMIGVPANSLAPGDYLGQVTINSINPASTSLRNINLTVLAIPGEIVVEDSILPADDAEMNFGNTPAGESVREEVTIRNIDGQHPIVINHLGLVADGSAGTGSGSEEPTVVVPVTRSVRQEDPFTVEEYDESRLIVSFKDAGNLGIRNEVHQQLGAKQVHRFVSVPADVVEFPKGTDLGKMLEAYEAMPVVAYAEPNYILRANLVPNDPDYVDQWGLKNVGQTGGASGADISAEEAWDISTGSDSIVVAIIDSGIDYNHPDLTANMWVNPNPTFGDVHGARWTSGSGAVTSGDPMDGHGHGTHVGGTVGAVGGNGIGVTGVAWNVKLMALKFLNDNGGGYTADAVAAIDYAIQNGAHLSNNSWGGGGFSQALVDIIAAAGQAGQLFIAAAGNAGMDTDANPSYPAAYDLDNIVSVANSDHNDGRRASSNWGATSVDLAAPGTNIKSTWTGGGYNSISGTSMASPHVAGVAALLLSGNPTAAPLDVRQWLLDGVDLLPAWAGLTVTGGRLNAAGALQQGNPHFLLDGVPAVPISILPGEQLRFGVTYTPDSSGNHVTTLRIESNDLDESVVDLAVSGFSGVNPLDLSPVEPFDSIGDLGGPFAPDSKTYHLNNDGSTPIDWSAAVSANWLEVVPASGTVPTGGSVPIVVNLTEVATQLAVGNHTDQLVLQDTVSGESVTRSVNLEVALSLCGALDACGLDWTTGGDAVFEGQSQVHHDTKDSGQSGAVEDMQHSWAEATLDSGGVLSFWWRVSSEEDYDYFQIWIDGALLASISGDKPWERKEYVLSPGSHTVRWRYIKDRSNAEGADAAWLDEVTFVPDTLDVTPNSQIFFVGFEGGPFVPESRPATINNLSSGDLEWQVASEASWLTLDPGNGAIPFDSSAVVTMDLNGSADSLVPGLYETSVSFEDLTGGQLVQRSVSLFVLPVPGDADVEDSVPPVDDFTIDFGLSGVGNQPFEQITLRNTDRVNDLVVTGLGFNQGQGLGSSPSRSPFDSVIPDDSIVTPEPPEGQASFELEHHPEALIVGFEAGVELGARDAIHSRVGTRRVHRFQSFDAEVVVIDSAERLEKAIDSYRNRAGVRYVEPNYKLSVSRQPNDPRFGEMYNLMNTGQTGGTSGADIETLTAWDSVVGDSSVVVAIIDTGIDYNHPDLAANMWVNPNPTAGDVHGARWTSGTGGMTSGDPIDGHGHGTHVAGTVGAVGDNSVGVSGVAWNVQLMALKFLDDSGRGFTADALAALDYAVAHGARISNNSWGGGGFSQALRDAIESAGNQNHLFVASAGNNNRNADLEPSFPAGYNLPNIISVASSDHNDVRSSFSNFGSTSVDLAAPGSNILSTWPGGSYNVISGTSMAAPHVSGVAALLLALEPNALTSELRDWILSSVSPVSGWSGLTATEGRLSASKAVRLATPNFRLHNLPEFPLTIPPNSSVNVSISFAPSFQGVHESVLQIESNDDGSPVVEVLVRGEAVIQSASVVGRHLFYNDSFYDLVSDANAIATDKTALLPGGTATFANYSSFGQGITGIMVDVQDLADPGNIGLEDFVFRKGNTQTPGNWGDAPDPANISVSEGAGAGGSDRITMIWSANSIRGEWLEVTVVGNGDTGLSSDDVFYFGNAPGDSGDAVGNAFVDISDEIGARNNPRSIFNRAPIDFVFDYDRDGLVDITDQLIARNNKTSVFTGALVLLNAPGGAGNSGLGRTSLVDRLPSSIVGEVRPNASLDLGFDNLGESREAWNSKPRLFIANSAAGQKIHLVIEGFNSGKDQLLVTDQLDGEHWRSVSPVDAESWRGEDGRLEVILDAFEEQLFFRVQREKVTRQ